MLADYGIFLLKFLTVALVIGGFILIIVSASRKGATPAGLKIVSINDDIAMREAQMRSALESKRAFRKFKKDSARLKKAEKRRDDQSKKRVFVIDFKGDLRATATASLREEISAILAVAESADEVVLRLENAGGAVHEHGLAASQLVRLKSAGIRLTVAVDKIAASGGYLMACVADHLIAAPFAIVGSIGVILQMPNFHRFLEERGVDYEQVTAGRFKRTLTMFGENTEAGREKLQQELEDVHDLFKEQVAQQRPVVEIESIATGEHWYGTRALDLKLIDAVGTSDDFLAGLAESAEVYKVVWGRPKSMQERLFGSVETLLAR